MRYFFLRLLSAAAYDFVAVAVYLAVDVTPADLAWLDAAQIEHAHRCLSSAKRGVDNRDSMLSCPY